MKTKLRNIVVPVAILSIMAFLVIATQTDFLSVISDRCHQEVVFDDEGNTFDSIDQYLSYFRGEVNVDDMTDEELIDLLKLEVIDGKVTAERCDVSLGGDNNA